jgi:hypothetical protein
MGFLAGGSWVNDAQRGTVLELNGQRDRVEISNSPEINAAKSYPHRTVAFWFRARQTAAVDKKKYPSQVIYEEGGSGAGLNIYLDADVLRAGTWSQGKGAWLQTRELKRDTWHHVAVILRTAEKTDTEASFELYLNGEKAADGKAPLLRAHPGDINLGRSGNTLFHDSKADIPAITSRDASMISASSTDLSRRTKYKRYSSASELMFQPYASFRL